MDSLFTWSRTAGYEVSSKGDVRYSAFRATLPSTYLNGRTIEQIYQCDIKGYDPGGTNWRLGKGKPPLNTSVNLWVEYLTLWRLWSHLNIQLMRELYKTVSYPGYNYCLSDMFATTEVNQAHALAECMNELIRFNGYNPEVITALESSVYKQPIYILGNLKELENG